MIEMSPGQLRWLKWAHDSYDDWNEPMPAAAHASRTASGASSGVHLWNEIEMSFTFIQMMSFECCQGLSWSLSYMGHLAISVNVKQNLSDSGCENIFFML